MLQIPQFACTNCSLLNTVQIKNSSFHFYTILTYLIVFPFLRAVISLFPSPYPLFFSFLVVLSSNQSWLMLASLVGH